MAVPLDQVIEANNASNVGLKKRDVQLARREDIMDVPTESRLMSLAPRCGAWNS